MEEKLVFGCEETFESEYEHLFFVDYFCEVNKQWVREPFCEKRKVQAVLEDLDLTSISDLRIQSYRDLMKPVNEEGETQQEWELSVSEDWEYCSKFIPAMQKLEWVFDYRYAISDSSPSTCQSMVMREKPFICGWGRKISEEFSNRREIFLFGNEEENDSKTNRLKEVK